STNLTLGARYTTETRAAAYGLQGIVVPSLDLTLPDSSAPYQSVRFNKFTYRVALDHRFSEQFMAYASFNTGFKSGGYKLRITGSPPYSPETLSAWEIGLKTDLFDRRLRVDLSAYDYDYRNLQVQQYGSGVIQTVNGARARIYGLDGDITAVLSSHLQLVGGFG